MKYSFPEGFIITDTSTHNFSISITDDNGQQYIINNNTYRFENGQLIVKFNEADENFDKLIASANVQFQIQLSGSFDSQEEKVEIPFTGSGKKEVIITQPTSSLSVEKTILDSTIENDEVRYQIKVHSEGENSNILVTDLLKSDLGLLKINQDVTATKTLNNISYTKCDDPKDSSHKITNGFTCTIPSMSDGEDVYIYYIASIDRSRLTPDINIAEATGNSVNLNNRNDWPYKSENNLSHKIQYAWISKTGNDLPADDTSNQMIWTIKINEAREYSVTGSTVTDEIAYNSRNILSYSGDGLTISVTKNDGSTEQRTIRWDDASITKKYDGSQWIGWEYHIPDTDEGNYSYVITYTTAVDKSGLIRDTNVSNTGTIGNSSSTGNASVGVTCPSTVKKEVVSYTSESVDWKIEVSVPAAVLSQLKVEDLLPMISEWNNGEYYRYYDILDLDSLRITINDDANTLYYKQFTTSDNENGEQIRSYYWIFYKDQKYANQGVNASSDGEDKIITITFSTTTHPKWLEYSRDTGDKYNHTNTAWITANNVEDNTNATVTLVPRKLEKKYLEKTSINGFLAYKYVIHFSNVDSDSIVIKDIIDSSLKDIFEIVNYDGTSNLLVYGDNTWDTRQNVTLEDTDDGWDLRIDQVPKTNDDEYYQQYKIEYWLKVKDNDALKTLQDLAVNNNNLFEITNEAKWGDSLTSTATVTYSNNLLDKSEIISPTKDNDYNATFKISINPEKLDHLTDLKVIDELSANLNIDLDSITIKDHEGQDISDVTYLLNRKTLTFNIPDASQKSVIITYNAKVYGSGSNVKYSNTVRIDGYTEEEKVEKYVTFETSGSGSGTIYSINLKK